MAQNGAWVVREPLCQPGFNGCPEQPEVSRLLSTVAELSQCLQGTTSCVSLEAADDTNYFLAKDRKLDEVADACDCILAVRWLTFT